MRSVNAIVELPISNLFLPDSWKQHITPPPTHPTAPPHPHFSILNCWSWVTGLHWLLGLFGNFVMVKWTLNMKICNKIDLVQVQISFQKDILHVWSFWHYAKCFISVSVFLYLHVWHYIKISFLISLHRRVSQKNPWKWPCISDKKCHQCGWWR